METGHDYEAKVSFKILSETWELHQNHCKFFGQNDRGKVFATKNRVVQFNTNIFTPKTIWLRFFTPITFHADINSLHYWSN